ncbi:MAG: 4-hydroxy-tetrahydrodipicolinate reductase [Actinomycetota bacterium]
MIRVGVIGACGRMGQMVCRAVSDDPELVLVAAIDRSHVGESIGSTIGKPHLEVWVAEELHELLTAEVEVAVDFTHPDVVRDDVEWAVAHAVDMVVGTTGLSDADLERIRDLLESEGSESNVIVAPNFALGAVLMQRFAAEAARFFPAAEVIELHHDGKADAPSGTALATARRIAQERTADYVGSHTESVAGARGGDVEGVRVHSVRLPGLVAHQEVILGAPGQTLTIRHDSMDRASFMPGVLMAIKAVGARPGLTVGLEPLLDQP